MTDHNPHLRRVASRRLSLFLIVATLVSIPAVHWLGWRIGLMAGFDAAASIFILSCMRLLHISSPQMIRAHACADDAGRWALLAISSLVMVAILAAVASELMAGNLPALEKYPFILATITLAWCFGNMVYALHYAHMHYTEVAEDGPNVGHGALHFPGTAEPDYWDFLYFAFTFGLAFATSDVNIESQRIRRVAILHCMAAFAFNIGVIGFTINLLAGLHN
jgi:uncharacterized membrane protein